MSVWGLRFFEHVHGHLGWLSTLALCHPALLLSFKRRRALLAAALATLLVTLTGAIGAGLYPSYRTLVKPAIFASSAAVGDVFERKEHLGVAVIVLAWIGLFAHWGEHRHRGTVSGLSRVALVAYSSAAVLALVSAGFGVVVAVYRTF